MARNYQRLFDFISRDNSYASQLQTRLSDISAQKRAENDADRLLQQIGVNGLEGRTVREMAKYTMERVKEQTRIPEQTESNPDIASVVQQMYLRAQYTPISDEATADIQELALQDAIQSAGGASAPNAGERLALIQKHLQDVPASKHTAAFNTMNRVWENELDRIGEYIREKDSSWTYWGDSFDTSILEGYVPGMNVWA